ncbi:hypothetical protein ENUP19_0275G0020 [Entamoeba nuttalli]|uniref:GPI mannosyltransferase 2 n=2 Tax=Entamoeba nuttalli TaxID=412467 RepID=K2HV64_ENTNP|nr:mannosyltransferase (pig-v) protein [Entamoeba nuttalli P19]EKE40085.1 mannosyltransferase (pig-v) protein [Entamoeba nuttalli P19]|eukprot:XP_008857580.1 mannosyltransferase (pig-v) protein [Entamoeba nuttalli P19]
MVVSPPIKLLIIGITTRLAYYLWMVMSSSILPPYDLQTYLLSENVSPYLAPFASWDGVHFLSIAMHGYVHEHQHAFFPLYPLTIRLFSFICSMSGFNEANIYIVFGLFISLVSFLVSLLTLYAITKNLMGEVYAFKTGVLFCFAPASVFLTSVYTESYYGCFSLLACYYLLSKNNILLSCVFFALASFIRSNGLINMGFVLYYFINTMVPFSSFPHVQKRISVKHIINTILLTISNLGPFMIYVYLASSQFCNLDPLPPYCKSKFPNVYSYNQSRYWNQGFLKYWRVKEIPNFLLCAPAAIISLVSTVIYLKKYFERHPLFHSIVKTSEPSNPKKFMLQNDALVYVVHLFVLVVFGLFCMHTQVITRFISACPAFYWGLLWLTEQKQFGIIRYLPIFYSTFFTFFGGVMFGSFYPWT